MNPPSRADPSIDKADVAAASSTSPPHPRPSVSTAESNSKPESTPGCSTNGEVRAAKRRKVATACDECRQRKSRCDGVKPSCGPCTRKGRGPGRCTYQNDLTRPTVSQSYIDELEARIRSLESNINSTTKTTSLYPQAAPNTERSVALGYPTAIHGAMQSYDTKITPPQLLIHMSPITDHLAQSGSQLQPHVKSKHEAGYTVGYSKLSFPEEVRECRFSNSVVTKDKADGMGATTGGGEDKGMGESESFFGTSSTASFMRQIQQTVDKKNLISLSPTDHAVRTPVGGSGECPLKQHGDDLPENAEDFILPQRNVADHLVDCYWTWVHSLYPFLHRPTFLGMYNSLWANEDFTQNAQPDFKLPGRMFRCILNLVFAFGCQFSPSIAPSSRDLSSDVFFKRSRLLLHVDILGSGSIQLVQALLLMGQYLQSTKCPNRCWNVVGLAIRVAQGLGLHLDATSQKRKSVVERETWRRAWHGCVLMDRVVSMTFGRPRMISLNTQVSLPLPVDDEYICDGSTICEQPNEQFSRLQFFISTSKLYAILGEILKIFYDASGSTGASSEGRKAENYYQSIMRLDRQLLNFQAELPAPLKLRGDSNSSPARDPVVFRQANVLLSRYLNIRILLFRPILINLIQESQPDQNGRHDTTFLEATLAVKCSVSCVAAAQEAIGLIDDNLLTGAVPAWWYYIFYLYTAASVLLAAKICPALDRELDYSSLEVSWKKCIEIMRSLESRYDSARRCLATLEVFHDQIMSSEEGHGVQHTGPEAVAGAQQEGGDMGLACEDNEVATDDPLLLFNHGSVWGADVNFDWFMEHPLWNSPDIM